MPWVTAATIGRATPRGFTRSHPTSQVAPEPPVEAQPDAAELVEAQPDAAELVEAQPDPAELVEAQPDPAELVEVQPEALTAEQTERQTLQATPVAATMATRPSSRKVATSIHPDPDVVP